MHLTLNPYDRSRPFARTKRKKSSEISPLPPPLKILLLIRMERQSCIKSASCVTIPKKTAQGINVHIPVNPAALINVHCTTNG